MLRTNLSTRPFYNERAVHVALALVAFVVALATVFTVTRIVRLSGQNTELSTRTTRDHLEAERLAGEAARVRGAINRDELERVALAAREANALIDQRTFSWTAFFNHIEATLPPDVMLVSVRPAVTDEQTRVSMTVLGRRTEDIDEFVEKLEASGAFESVIPTQSDQTGDGLQRAILDSVYTAAGAEPEPAEAGREGAPQPKRGAGRANGGAP